MQDEASHSRVEAEGGHEATPLTEELCTAGGFSGKESQFALRVWSLVDRRSSGRPTPSTNWNQWTSKEKEKELRLGRKEVTGGNLEGVKGRGKGEYDRNKLYVCMKDSKNNKIVH